MLLKVDAGKRWAGKKTNNKGFLDFVDEKSVWLNDTKNKAMTFPVIR